jgi:hypothetical protein
LDALFSNRINHHPEVGVVEEKKRQTLKITIIPPVVVIAPFLVSTTIHARQCVSSLAVLEQGHYGRRAALGHCVCSRV